MNPPGLGARSLIGDEAELEELLRRVAAGDEESFARLYDLEAPLLYGLACRMLGDGAEAEDAVQEIFLKVWSNAVSYDPARGSPRAWLIVLGRSRCLDRLRRRSTRRRLESGSAEPEEPAPDRRAQVDELASAETCVAVRAALAALPAPQRQALEAAYFDGLTQAEIAQRSGEPLGTIKTRMRLGMLKLMELLRPAAGSA